MLLLSRGFIFVYLLLSFVFFNVKAFAYESPRNVKETVTVHPDSFDGILTNPGMGVENFHNHWGETLTLEEYPDTGIQYFRFYWSEVEPVEGEYNFSLIDDVIALAREHKPAMSVALRFMALEEPTTGTRIPKWLMDKGVDGQWSLDGSTFIPDLDDPIFLSYTKRLLDAFGAKYDGNPNLAHIDIGMVGAWGEWHNSDFTSITPLAERYSTEQLNRYVDMHFDAFPNTPKVMLISGGETLAYAVQRGAGWRADCWGDWHEFSSTWNHMEDDYPQRLYNAEQLFPDFGQAWEKAPVSFEICGYMPEWLSERQYTKEQVQASFDWAIAHHASSLNLKSRAIPAIYRPIVDEALLKIGYRFRLAEMTHQKSIQLKNKKNKIAIDAVWYNDGIAPLYNEHYHLAYRFVNELGDVVYQDLSHQDLREWLPGKHLLNDNLSLPKHFKKGSYYLEIAIVDNELEPNIQLAIDTERNGDWYRVSSIEIK